MKSLLIFEIAKILRRKTTVWLVVGVIAINVISIISGISSSAVVDRQTVITGLTAIKLNQQIAEEYEGIFTNDTIDRVIADYGPTTQANNGHYRWNNTNSFVSEEFVFMERTLEEAFPFATEPLYFGYAQGWLQLADVFSVVMWLMLVVIVVTISPVFSDEYHSRMDMIILPSKYGKSKVSLAKIAASFITMIPLAALIAALNYLTHGVIYGFGGLNVHMHCTMMGLSSYPLVMTWGEYLTQTFICFMLATLGTTAITLLVSSLSRTSFVAIIISIIVIFIPLFICMTFPKQFISGIAALFPSGLISDGILLDSLLPDSLFSDGYTTAAAILTTILLVACILGSSRRFRTAQA